MNSDYAGRGSGSAGADSGPAGAKSESGEKRSAPRLRSAPSEYEFAGSELEDGLRQCAEKGITEFVMHDRAVAADKARLLRFLRAAGRCAPRVFVSFRAEAAALDADVCRQALNLRCSAEIPFSASDCGGSYRFDKKLYARRAAMLNQAGLVFGAELRYADVSGDSLRLFCDRLDFTAAQYPNHIDFPQTESADCGGAFEKPRRAQKDGIARAGNARAQKDGAEASRPRPAARATALFSAEDIRCAENIAFACRTFYSAGRAVPWFLSILKPLKIQSSRFFADFAEWQRCGSCDARSGFVPEAAAHAEIEKMQLSFLASKYEEKNAAALFPAVRDIVRLHGAFSRLTGEGEESVLETRYHPDDLLYAGDVAALVNDVCMEDCRVRIFDGGDGPDYEVL